MIKHIHSVAFALFVFLGSAIGLAAEKPNIVFMIADDCTFRDVGCYGGQAHTPNIDRLAEQGMRFTRCFQSAPMCSPTRHNLYTGLYPVTSGAYPNHTFVPDETQSIVQYLTDLGYQVAQSGKSHVAPPSVFAWEKIPGNSNPVFDKVDDFVSECATADEPFCLLLCSNEPHTPWNKGDPSRYPPQEIKLPPYFVDTPQTRRDMSHYLAEVTYFDSQVGAAIDMLDRHALADNTLLVVVTEQGNSMPFAKWTCYDNGLQSAMIVRWPGQIEPSTVNDAMVEYIDLLPTFIEVAGGTPGKPLQGKSLRGVFEGSSHHKDYVFGIMTTRGINAGSDHFGIRSVRSGQFKYIWNLTPQAEFNNACTDTALFQSWIARAQAGDEDAMAKVQRYQHRPEFEFYNIVDDPLELNNLADNPKYEAAKKRLHVELLAWMQRCGDEGQATEMEALHHMKRNRKASR